MQVLLLPAVPETFGRNCTLRHCSLYISFEFRSTKGCISALVLWVSNVDGLSKNGFVRSEVIASIGRAWTILHTSHIKVVSSSWVRFLLLTSDNIESGMFLVVLILRSQTPPIWEECGGLKSQTVPLSNRNFFSQNPQR